MVVAPHSIIELPRFQFVARNQYPRTMVRNIWIAFRAEWIKAGLSRERFADYIADTINGIQNNQNVADLRVGNFYIPDSLPRPETYENFVKSGLTNQNSKTYQSIGDTAKASVRTLQIIHFFLWNLRPETVCGWDDNDTSVTYDELVGNLDDSFEILLPQDVLPRKFKLYAIAKEKLEKDAKHYTNALQAFQDGISDRHNKDWKLFGVLCLDGTQSNTACNAFFLEQPVWRDLQKSLCETKGKREVFAYYPSIIPAGSILYKHKDMLSESGTEKPYINDKYYRLSIRMRNTLSNSFNYITLDCYPDKLMPAFNSDVKSDIKDIVFTLDKMEDRVFLPVKLDPEEESMLNEVCNYGSY